MKKLLLSSAVVLLSLPGISEAQTASPSISSYIEESHSVQTPCIGGTDPNFSVVGQTFVLRWDLSEYPFNDPLSLVGYWSGHVFVLYDNPSGATIYTGPTPHHGDFGILSFLGCVPTSDVNNILLANRQSVINRNYRVQVTFVRPNGTSSQIVSNISPIIQRLLPNPALVPTGLTSHTKDPINIATGEMTIHATDFSSPTQGPRLQLSRVYRSHSGASGMFGYGWHSLLDASLAEDANGNIIMYDEEGTGSYFHLLPNGSYAPSGGTHAILVKDRSGTFTLTDNHGKVRAYGVNGRLSSISDRNGNTLSVSFDPGVSSNGYLEDATGRQITLAVDASGRIIQAKDPSNRIVTYSYDSAGNLSAITDALGNATQYIYDSNHNITEMTNVNGHKTYFAYDTQDRAYQNWQDNDANKVTLDFQSGNVTIVTDALGNQSRYQFNEYGLEISYRDPLNRTTSTSWDTQLNRTSVTDPLGRTTTFFYDNQGNLLQTKDALNQISSFTYTLNFDLLKTVTDARGGVTVYEYDSRGNLTKVTNALSKITQMTYDAKGNLLTSKDPLSNTTTHNYNQYGQRVSTNNALNQLTSIVYDIVGNVLSITDAANHTTAFIYDAQNRLKRANFADGSSEEYGYDAFGNRTVTTDRKGRQTTKTYDIYERLTQVTDPEGGVTRFAYDKEGRKISLTDPLGQTTTFGYDAAGQLTSEINALNQSTTYVYDAAGNLLSKTDANYRTTNYTYDGLNRLTRTDYADGSSVEQGFDALSRRTSMTDRFGTTTYSYDALGRLLSEEGPGASDTITYTYDAVGNRVSMTDQDNRVFSYTYDALNRLRTVTIGSASTQYTYDNVGNLTSIVYPNTGRIDYFYDVMNRPVNVSNTSIVGTVSSFQYVYDLAGQVIRKTLLDGSIIDYSYDAKDQLIRELKTASASAASGSYDHTYTYDAAGNRSSWVKTTTLGNFWTYDSAGLPQQTLNALSSAGFGIGKKVNKSQTLRLRKVFSHDAGNRVLDFQYNVEVGGQTFLVETVTYAHDTKGNRTEQNRARSGETVQVTQYAYDDENRLTSLAYQNVPSAGIPGAQYEYNGDGRRKKAVEGSTTVNYLYDGSEVLLEKDAAGATVRSYTRSPGFPGGISGLISQRMKVAVTTGKGKNKTTTLVDKDFYYHYDALGSVTDITDDAGAVNAKSEYDAFGNKVSESNSIGNAYQFSTKEWEGHAGLSYFGARYYDPSIGRWLTPDPLGFVDGPNLFTYVTNNPTNIVDPYGEMGERSIVAEFGDGVRTELLMYGAHKYTELNAARLTTDYETLLRAWTQYRPGVMLPQFVRATGRLAAMARVIELGTTVASKLHLANELAHLVMFTAETISLTVQFADKFDIGPSEILGILQTRRRLANTEFEIQRNEWRRSAPFIAIGAGGTCNPRAKACLLP